MGGCKLIATEHGRYCLSCMPKLHVECTSSPECVWLLLLNMADILYAEGCEVNNSYCFVCLFSRCE